MTNVTVLGLGIMGSGIAHNILKAGDPLTVYNRTQEKATPLIEAGAQWADSPALAARHAEVVISMVGDDVASGAMWLGPDGAFATMPPQTIAVECSTLSLDWIREWHAEARQHRLKSIEAPVTGSKLAAESGTLTLLIGGDADVLAQARLVLSSFSNNLLHFGPATSGTLYKLINNLQGAIHLLALSEGLAIAERAGLNMSAVLEAVMSGAASSPIVKGKAARVIDRDYENVHFSVRWMYKDLTYALRAADELGVPTLLAAAAHEVYKMALQLGLGDLDIAAVNEVLRQRP
ncbi:MAG TPA: NAD(P)-dependent oxidoreductase [Anaerolineae bacterium]|nr:NAD(P)-dependent oxidoreductase [Anaerolineae bacterium]